MTIDRNRPQRNWGPRIRDLRYHAMRLVALENEQLRVGVLADKGADVVELLYKPRDLDFVYLTPAGVRNPAEFLSTSPDRLATFIDTYPGGWQEIFPNAGAAATWNGAQFGQHGEVFALPWDVRIDEESEQAAAVTFTVRGLKSPFRLERTLRLETGQPTLALSGVVTNESDLEQRAMWGHHIVFGQPFLDETCRIQLPEGVQIIPHPESIHPAGRRVSPDRPFGWPNAPTPEGGTVDLSSLAPRGTVSEIVYLTGFSEGWYQIEHPGKGIGMRVEWDAETMPYLWYWMEFGGTTSYPWHGRPYVIGLEPHSSYPTNGLPDAVANGSALAFGPREARSFWLRATIVESTGG